MIDMSSEELSPEDPQQRLTPFPFSALSQQEINDWSAMILRDEGVEKQLNKVYREVTNQPSPRDHIRRLGGAALRGIAQVGRNFGPFRPSF
jgi:hypothetical protein